ncbi:hypothetical protein VTK73DRAFT_7895 [Phialemonium thermophilum]|uniref:Uncharacterized protein n=1 Tax=Phialemonium thermophilum TaxID=223376 RepID=A0ABR3WC52_9PEZI
MPDQGMTATDMHLRQDLLVLLSSSMKYPSWYFSTLTTEHIMAVGKRCGWCHRLRLYSFLSCFRLFHNHCRWECQLNGLPADPRARVRFIPQTIRI